MAGFKRKNTINSDGFGKKNDVEKIVSQVDKLTNYGIVTKREIMTQAQYDVLVIAGTTVETTEYIIVG